MRRGDRPGGAWLTAVGLLAVAAALSLTAPPIAAAELRAALGRLLGAQSVDAEVTAWPPPVLWAGRVDALRVATRHLRIGMLDVEAFDAALDRLQFDPGALYLKGALVIRSLGAGTARATVSQEALARLLEAQPSIRDVTVTLDRGRVALTATVMEFGAALRVTGDGRLLLRNPTAVDLMLDRLSVGGVSLPQALIDQIVGGVNPILDVTSFPLGLRLTGIRVEGGKVALDAAVGGR